MSRNISDRVYSAWHQGLFQGAVGTTAAFLLFLGSDYNPYPQQVVVQSSIQQEGSIQHIEVEQRYPSAKGFTPVVKVQESPKECTPIVKVVRESQKTQSAAVLPDHGFKEIRTRLQGSQLETTLEEIRSVVRNFPVNYQEVISDHTLHLLPDTQREQYCGSNAGGCYSRKMKIVRVGEKRFKDLFVHEVGHSIYENLPSSDRSALQKTIGPIVKEARKHAILYPDGRVRAWTNGDTGYGYGCPTAYAASNDDEYVAEMIEDIIANDGKQVVGLFRNGGAEQMHQILPQMYTAGLLGEGQEAYDRLSGIYQQAGFIPPTFTETIVVAQ